MIRILYISSDGKHIPNGLLSNEWNIISCSEQHIQSKQQQCNTCDMLIWHTQSPNVLIAKQIMESLPNKSLIILSSACNEKDRINLLKEGADEIFDASISSEELALKLRSFTRRLGRSYTDIMKIGKYHFDYERRVLTLDQDNRLLTTKEAELLKFLTEHLNYPSSKHDALLHIWGEDTYHNGRSMDVYIGKLRKYLQSDENIQIMNIHGMGYKLSILS